jgi:hypothetical protein
MTRVINVAERNLFPNGATPVTVAAAVSTDVIPDQVNLKLQEIAYRYIQNTGSGLLYYAFGQDCNLNNFHGVISQYQQLDCSNHRLRVSVWSVSGGQVATTILYRNDNGRNDAFVK